MGYGQPDRIPRFEEGIRDEVLSSWESQGLAKGINPVTFFEYDVREEIEIDLDPRPESSRWPRSLDDLRQFRACFQASDDRLQKGWRRRLKAWRTRSIPLILRVHRGFFLSMGVEGWQGFHETLALTKDEPKLVAEVLQLQGDLSASMADRFLSEVNVDAALFSEPIGGDHGSLISPKMYTDLVIPSYQPIFDVLKRHQVPVTIMRTYANPSPLVAVFVDAGINCLWAVEAPPDSMDYLRLRQEFGKKLCLIGGIDTDALRQGRAAIRQAVERVAPLAVEGGYIPLLDGRVREGVNFSDYCFYRELLKQLG